MNPDGTIYDLPEGEKPKPGHFKLTELEKAAMERIAPPARAEALRRVRKAAKTMAAPKRPKSCMPKSLRR